MFTAEFENDIHSRILNLRLINTKPINWKFNYALIIFALLYLYRHCLKNNIAMFGSDSSKIMISIDIAMYTLRIYSFVITCVYVISMN